jgi:hypothetical protein
MSVEDTKGKDAAENQNTLIPGFFRVILSGCCTLKQEQYLIRCRLQSLHLFIRHYLLGRIY